MAVNVKTVKRVINSGNPLKELNVGTNKPAFRSNGYKLTFDSVENDYGTIGKNYDNIALKDINTFISFYTDFSASGKIYSIGRNISGFVDVRQFNDGRILIEVRITGGVLVYTETFSFLSSGYYNVSFDSTGVLFNGVRVHTYADPNLVITFSAGIYRVPRLNSAYYIGEFSNVTILEAEIFGVTYPFDETSRGATITGSDGTVLTLSTIHAGGVDYLDEKVWGKKSFSLSFDKVESEYISLSESISVNDVFEITFSTTDLTATSLLFDDSTSSIFRAYFANGVITVAGCTLDALIINGVSFPITTDLRLHYGSVIHAVFTSASIANLATILARGTVSNFTTAIIYGLSIRGKKYPLNEGLGNEVWSEDKTEKLTLHTNHAGGVDRINFGMWLKNGYVLKFDKVESEFLLGALPVALTAVGQINFDLTIIKQSLGGQVFSVGISSEGLFSVYETASGLEIIDIRDGAGIQVYSAGVGTFTELNTDIKYTFDGATFTRESSASGLVSVDLSAFSNTPLNLGTNRNFSVARISYLNSRFADYTLKDLTFLGEEFLLKEGQGTTTEGENGTIANLYTNHAGGTDKMWSYSLNKWLPYKQQ